MKQMRVVEQEERSTIGLVILHESWVVVLVRRVVQLTMMPHG